MLQLFGDALVVDDAVKVAIVIGPACTDIAVEEFQASCGIAATSIDIGVDATKFRFQIFPHLTG